MWTALGTLASLVSILASSANVPSAEELSREDVAVYRGLEPGAFMKQWLVCGPFPVSDGPEEPEDGAVQIQAFYRDFLTQHGGEANIAPAPQMVHQANGREYRWQYVASESDIVSLTEVYGAKEYAIAYAWAEIEMPAAQGGLLGIGSDDAVKVWLNGEQVYENWTDRPARADDDLVLVNFEAGKNRLLVKVQNRGELWGFVCRLLDAKTLGDKLRAAVSDGEWGMAQLCLSYGADVNAKDKYGFTPLHVARMRGHEEIEKLLLAKGADPDIEMPETGTPLAFLDILWDSLQENYPMMEYAGAFDESWYESCKEEIKDINSLGEALPIMDKMLVRRLNDYHTNLFWGGKPYPITPPIRLNLVEDQIVVIQCPEELGVVCGDVVLEIDGTHARECFDRALPEAFGATQYVKTGTACRTIIEGQPDSKVTLKLRNRQGQGYEVVLTRGGSGGAAGRESVLSSRVVNDDIGYIRIRGWGGFAPEEFDKLLEPLREKPCLILDVRDNGGGSDRLAETVIGRFITQRTVCSISFQRQPGTDMYEKLIHIAEPRGPWCYEGKIAVLTNEGCASACEHFVSGMFEAGAVLVGRPTTGACGWSKGIDLPGGVTLACALTFPLHGKVPSPLHGIEPHHLVTPTIDDIRSGRDTILEKAMALLTGNK